MPAETKTAPAPKQSADDIDPQVDPIGYLVSKGWRPIGLKNHPLTRWIPPGTSINPKGKKEKIPIMAANQNGEVSHITVKTGVPGEIKLGFQEKWTPPAIPVFRDNAIQIQMEKDAIALAIKEEEEEEKQAKEQQKK